MRVPITWLSEFVDLPESVDQLRLILDDLGLVVESVETIGAGLEKVVVARVDEIHAIDGADRIRRVVADAGHGPVEIVCGAMNFEVGNHVPFAPVGAVLPGDFVIAQRTLRGVTSNGMLCSGRELGLSSDHAGLMILDGLGSLVPGTSLLELLSIEPDLVLDISPEGNRPDAWSVEGVARDVAVRLGQSIRPVALASPNTVTESSSAASCAISSPELCGMLTLGVLEHVTVADSPRWIQQRLTAAGMRPVNNVVDASNYVMLELGQPTHPYDAALVAGRHLGVRRATSGETLRTLDGTDRVLGETGRGLGDTGIDCVIVDGDDVVIGLGGIMGGATSVITAATTEVLVEAAFFDPMTIARTSKRLGLRSEASNRFERGVDPTLASRALGRFVTLLRESSPELEFLATPVVASGTVPIPPTVTMTHDQLFNLLGTNIALDEAAVLLRGISFEANVAGDVLTATAPPSRLDVREGIAGRADVIEEIARLYSYGRLVRRTPTWVEPGGLTWRQQFRRRVRDAVVGLGFLEAWTASFVSDADFDLVTSSPLRVRVTNPLSAEESLLRSSLLVGLTRAWGRNVERGVGDVALFEMGTVVDHPGWSDHPRETRGGRGGSEKIELPTEHEMLLMVLGRPDDDARTAAATWHVMAERWELRDVVVRSAPAPSGWHPTRFAQLVDRATEMVVGRVGELDPGLLKVVAPAARDHQRAGLIEIDLDVLSNPDLVARRDEVVAIVSRFPDATIDLAFVTPDDVNAGDLAHHLRLIDSLVTMVTLFDVFRGDTIAAGARSLAYAVRLSAPDRTLSDREIADTRERLIGAAGRLGAQLR